MDFYITTIFFNPTLNKELIIIIVSYFTKHVAPALKSDVYGPGIEKDLTQWTNSNYESMNHILKLDAKWKPAKKPRIDGDATPSNSATFQRRLKKRYSIS